MNQSVLLSQVEAVRSRDDLVAFIQALSNELKSHPENWENSDLSSFLSAMAAWVQDMDGYYLNQKKEFSEDQSWKTFAEILYSARIYE